VVENAKLSEYPGGKTRVGSVLTKYHDHLETERVAHFVHRVHVFDT
jgi:hypothetical protein